MEGKAQKVLEDAKNLTETFKALRKEQGEIRALIERMEKRLKALEEDQ